MKKISMVIYIITLYAFPIVGVKLFNKIPNWELLLTIIGAVMFIAWLIVIICTLRSFVTRYGNNLAEIKRIRIYKTLMIPWFFLNYSFWSFLVGGFANPFLMMGIPLVIITGVVFTYATMMTTSLMALAEIVRLKRAGLISNGKTLKLAVFQFIFILDIVGAIMLYYTEKKALESAKNT